MTPRKRRSDAGKPRQTTVDDLCDRFAALPAEKRDGLLLTLQQIDRVLRRRDHRATQQLGALADPAQNAALEFADGADGRDDLDSRTDYEIGAERCPPRE